MALPKWYGRKGRRWLRLRERVLRESRAWGLGCVWCGHSGYNDVNHNVPRSKAPWLAMERTNLGPIHGREGCPTCGRKCNQELGPRVLSEVQAPVMVSASRAW